LTTQPPILLLTRPAPQAQRFARAFTARFGSGIPVVCAPVLRIAPVAAELSLEEVTGLIFTSGEGVRRFTELSEERRLPAYCVGQRTTALARAAGLHARMAGTDVEAALEFLRNLAPGERLLHLRGAHSRGDLAARLSVAGCLCEAGIVYDQQEQSLSEEASALLRSEKDVLLPVFSPRSASLLAKAAEKAQARLFLAAISPAAQDAWTGPEPEAAEVAAQPDAASMLDALGRLIDACHLLETRKRAR